MQDLRILLMHAEDITPAAGSSHGLIHGHFVHGNDRHQHWFSPPVIEVHVYDITGGEIKRKSRENQTKIKRMRPPRPAARRRGTKKGPSSEDGAAYRQMEHTSAGMEEGATAP